MSSSFEGAGRDRHAADEAVLLGGESDSGKHGSQREAGAEVWIRARACVDRCGARRAMPWCGAAGCGHVALGFSELHCTSFSVSAK